MAARGTPIEGWWCWWPFHGAEYARRFATKEDALAYLPNIKTKQGDKHPLGRKLIMRVAWSEQGWSHDAPITVTQQGETA